jgi:hypothetical protein
MDSANEGEIDTLAPSATVTKWFRRWRDNWCTACVNRLLWKPDLTVDDIASLKQCKYRQGDYDRVSDFKNKESYPGPRSPCKCCVDSSASPMFCQPVDECHIAGVAVARFTLLCDSMDLQVYGTVRQIPTGDEQELTVYHARRSCKGFKLMLRERSGRPFKARSGTLYVSPLKGSMRSLTLVGTPWSCINPVRNWRHR